MFHYRRYNCIFEFGIINPKSFDDVFIDHNRELMYNDRCQCLDVGLFVQARECCMESLRLGG